MRWGESMLLATNVLSPRSSDICRHEMKGKRRKQPEKGESANRKAATDRTFVLTEFEVSNLSCGVIVKYDYRNRID